MSRALQINSSPQGWMARNTKPVPLAEKGWAITMKKISIILLSAVLVFSMAACNGGKEKADNQTEKQTESVKPTEEVAMVKGSNDQAVHDFLARRLYNMTGDIVMSLLILDDATKAPEMFQKSANVYVRMAEEEVLGHSAYIQNFKAEDLESFKA